METGLVERQIRRSNRNLLCLGAILTLIGAGTALGFPGALVVPAVFGLPGVVCLGFWLRRMVRPAAHPLRQDLRRYGDPQEVSEQVDREFAGASAGQRLLVGPRWLLQRDTFQGMRLVPWTDIAWMHLWTLKSRGSGAQSTSVQLWTRGGQTFLVDTPLGSKKEDAQQLLRELHGRAPWAELGYTVELKGEWDKRRPQFLQRVEARRAQA